MPTLRISDKPSYSVSFGEDTYKDWNAIDLGIDVVEEYIDALAHELTPDEYAEDISHDILNHKRLHAKDIIKGLVRKGQVIDYDNIEKCVRNLFANYIDMYRAADEEDPFDKFNRLYGNMSDEEFDKYYEKWKKENERKYTKLHEHIIRTVRSDFE